MFQVKALRRYKKLISSVVAAGIAWATIVTQSASDSVTSAEWIAAAVLAAGALGVERFANTK